MDKKDAWILFLGILVAVGIVYIIFFTGCECNDLGLGPAGLREFDRFSFEPSDDPAIEGIVNCGKRQWRVGDSCGYVCETGSGDLSCSSCDAGEECYEVWAV